jgi:PAS domain S-box-containing protein
MKVPKSPRNEQERLAALHRSALLDTVPEERFDRYTRMACRIFRVPIALVTLVDRNRQWFKSCQGLTTPETPRDISFCGHAILHSDTFVIEDALYDDRFSDNPLVTEAPFIRFYAGAPLHDKDGFRLGTLCLIDRIPRKFSYEDEALLRDLADCVEREIKLQATSAFYSDLKQSERRARSVIEGTRVGTWEWNIQTGETVFNERWANICGYELEELEPVSIQTWLNLAHPEDLVESERLLNAHFSGELDEYDYRCRMHHKDGHWVWVHDRGKVFEWTEDGRPLLMYGTHADITAEMANLERMQQQNTALSILNDLAIDPETDDDVRISRALRLGAEYLGMPLAIVSEITGNVYTVRWFDAPSDAGLSQGLTFDLADTYCAITVTREGSLAIGHMARSEYRDRPCYDQFGLESYVAAPIYVQDKLFGTLNFSSPSPRPNGFSDTEVKFVTLLARWIAGVLERQVSMQTLKKLVEQTPGMLYQYRLWPDGSSAFPFSSPGIRDIFQVNSEDVEEDASVCFERIHPDDADAVVDSIQQSACDLTVWQQQYRIRRDNHWRWVEGRATPELLADHSFMWHGYIVDIDDKKQIQLALQESEDQLRRMFELSPIGIALTDYHTGEFLDVNEALLEPMDFSREEIMASNVNLLFGDATEEVRSQILADLKSTGRFGPYEHEIRRSDGTTFPAVTQGMRITNPSGRALVWSLIEDISERKKIDRMKSEFISTVSHELRTPLTSLAGSLGLVAGGALGPLSEQVDQMISIAARNSEQLKLLINDLLDMEKLVSGNMAMDLQPEAVGPLVEDTIHRLRTYALDQHINVQFQNPECQQKVVVDSQRLEQALTNLLSNAIKFSPTGSEVIVTASPNSDHLEIRVKDQGPGIPQSFRSRIFEKFAQADSSNTRGRRGTGLGLAITREIMTQMGGDVGFDSVEGQGSEFWLKLPYA